MTIHEIKTMEDKRTLMNGLIVPVNFILLPYGAMV